MGLGYLKLTSQIGEGIIDDFEDFLSIDAISKYFFELFIDIKENNDKNGILAKIDKNSQDKINNGINYEYDFEDIGSEFKFIENLGRQIIVPTDEAEKILNTLKFSKRYQ